jgi:hypothetical protein
MDFKKCILKTFDKCVFYLNFFNHQRPGNFKLLKSLISREASIWPRLEDKVQPALLHPSQPGTSSSSSLLYNSNLY